MHYTVRIFHTEDVSEAERADAAQRFRTALEASLGDASLVVPVYRAYLNILGQHGESPDTEALTVDERMVLETWQQAESAAMEAVFGPHRHLDEGGYQIVLPS